MVNVLLNCFLPLKISDKLSLGIIADMQNKRDFFSQKTNFDWFALLLPQKVQGNYPGYLIIYILSSLETNILQTSQIKENSCPSKLMFA